MNEIYYYAPDDFSFGVTVENEEEFAELIQQNSEALVPFLAPYNFDGFEEYGFKTNNIMCFLPYDYVNVTAALPGGQIKTYKYYGMKFRAYDSSSGMSRLDYEYLKMAVILSIKNNPKYHSVLFEVAAPGSDMKNDMNFDGKSNLIDVLQLRKYLAENTSRINIIDADVNTDGQINMLDVLSFRKIIAEG